MDHRSLAQIIVYDEAKIQESKKKTNVQAVMNILNKEYQSFQDTKSFVLKNLHKLKGHMVPVEIMQITNLPSHDCIILNDLLLIPYSEAEGWIMDIMQKEKEKEENDGK